MKKTAIPILGLIFLPLLFATFIKKDLADLFADRRTVYRAEPLESIQGGRAGKRVEAPLAQVRAYEVQKGDTYWSIAQKYGIADPNALAKHNRMRTLVPGAVIEIPQSLRERP